VNYEQWEDVKRIGKVSRRGDVSVSQFDSLHWHAKIYEVICGSDIEVF
jgi:hypothetical protein